MRIPCKNVLVAVHGLSKWDCHYFYLWNIPRFHRLSSVKSLK